MTHKSDRVRFFVKTNAPCLDPQIGALLDDYLDEKLSEVKRQSVRAHLRRCVACATYVSNSKATRAAERGRVPRARPRKMHAVR